MLFIYSISEVIKTQAVLLKGADTEAELHTDEALLLQIFNARSPEAKALILKFATTDFNLKDHDSFFEAKKAKDEAISILETLQKTKYTDLAGYEILLATSFRYLPKEKQNYILLDTNLARFAEQLNIQREIAAQKASHDKFMKHMKWKFYSGKATPAHLKKR